MTIQNYLFEKQDKSYAEFQSSLVPTIPCESVIGVRIPLLRQFAKNLMKQSGKDAQESDLMWRFLAELPHNYYDENMLHGILISEIRDYGKCLAAVEAFLPYVDNWAVCDTMSPKIFKTHKDELFPVVKKWIASEHTYTCRFGMKTLMQYYLDDAFEPEYLKLPAAVCSDEYYVNMMVAWFFATALAKQWESAIPYLTEKRLPVWTHNKTIQKAIESYRITEEQKIYLKKYLLRDHRKSSNIVPNEKVDILRI